MSTASFVTATIPQQKDGVDKDIFTYEGGKLRISEYGAKGLFFGTALRRGMEVLTVNNVDSDVYSMSAILSLLEEEEFVTILAKRPELPSGLLVAEAIQKEISEEVGLEFDVSDGRLMIAGIADGSIAAKSKLMVGMQVFMIGNATCVGLSPDRALDLIVDSTEDVVVVAGTPSGDATRRRLVVATLEKDAKDAPIGLMFMRQDGKLKISNISEGSLAADSDLTVGLDLLSINNVDCTRKRVSEVNSLLEAADAPLIILAERPQITPGVYVTGTVFKESVDTLVGVTMLQQGDNVYFKYINPDGPVAETDLQVGMMIVSINNISCAGMSVKQVVTHLRSATHLLTVLAQTTNMKFEEPKPTVDESLNDSDVTMDFDPNEDAEDKEGPSSEDAEGNNDEEEDAEDNGSIPKGGDRGFSATDADAWD